VLLGVQASTIRVALLHGESGSRRPALLLTFADSKRQSQGADTIAVTRTFLVAGAGFNLRPLGYECRTRLTHHLTVHSNQSMCECKEPGQTHIEIPLATPCCTRCSNPCADPGRHLKPRWQAVEKVVYSRTLPAPTTTRTRLERSFDPAAVRQLKQSSTSDLSIGGADLAGQAMGAGLVDECQLFLAPIAVGGGKPALPLKVRQGLHLLDEHRFTSGMIFLRYAILPSAEDSTT
jgi:dihydrofolate reductase